MNRLGIIRNSRIDLRYIIKSNFKKINSSFDFILFNFHHSCFVNAYFHFSEKKYRKIFSILVQTLKVYHILHSVQNNLRPQHRATTLPNIFISSATSMFSSKWIGCFVWHYHCRSFYKFNWLDWLVKLSF